MLAPSGFWKDSLGINEYVFEFYGVASLSAWSYLSIVQPGIFGALTLTENVSSGERNWHAIATSSDCSKILAIVVGGGGDAALSIDGGATWNNCTSAGQHDWRQCASSRDGSILSAVRNKNRVYTSHDSGATWVPRDSVPYNDWRTCLVMSEDGMIHLVGGFGSRLYRSIDYGVTWTETLSPSDTWRSGSMSANGQYMLAGVYGGYMHVSSDYGYTWTQCTSAGQRNWRFCASSSNGQYLVAIVLGGYIYTSSDGGTTWTQRSSAGNRYWRSVAISKDGSKIAATDVGNGESGGYIYLSSDYGATWTPIMEAGFRKWRGVSLSYDGLSLAAAANDGNIWTFRPRILPNYGSSLVSGVSAFAVAINPTSIELWKERISSGANARYGISGSSTLTKMVASVGTAMQYTGDGGATWTTASQDQNFYKTTSSSDGVKCAVACYPGYVWTSTDSGATWTPRTGSGSRNFSCIASSSDGVILAAVVMSGRIYISTDSGETWTTRLVSYDYSGIAMSNSGQYMCAIRNSGALIGGDIVVSTDTGDTWNTVGVVAPWDGVCLSSTGQYMYIATYDNHIYKSSDYGATWAFVTTSPNRRWKCIDCSDSGAVVIAASNEPGRIWISTNYGVNFTEQTGAPVTYWRDVAISADGTKFSAITSLGSNYVWTLGL